MSIVVKPAIPSRVQTSDLPPENRVVRALPAPIRGPLPREDRFLERLPGRLRSLWPTVFPYEDLSAGLAIERLKRTPGMISGDAMTRTIMEAISDLDGQGASAEYRDLRRFAEANWHRMSPDARQAFRAYEDEALRAQSMGLEGIPTGRLEEMVDAMIEKRGGCGAPRYEDESVRDAILPLEQRNGLVNTRDMLSLFEATLDADGQLFGQEFSDIARFVDNNWERLTPGARAAFKEYERAALEARAEGREGGSILDVASLLQRMVRAADLADDPRLYRPMRG